MDFKQYSALLSLEVSLVATESINRGYGRH